MNPRRFAAAVGVAWQVMGGFVAAAGDEPQANPSAAAALPDGATLLRVFLTDGSSLVSYGEPARVGNRVVFSIPTSASRDNPQLHLVNLDADRFDWERTNRYAEAARAMRYLETRAESDYALLTSDIASALTVVSRTVDPAAQLAVVENARRRLANWPAGHYNFKRAEIRDMLGMLDEIIAELRAATGVERFDLSFVASVEDPIEMETLLPLPTPKETIEQVITAAYLSDLAPERVSLLSTALKAIDHDADVLPSDWRTDARRSIKATIASELETDRQYQTLTSTMIGLAARRARLADVRGVQAVLADIEANDRMLGASRPEVVAALIQTVEEQLDAARRLRLERDRWALRLPEIRKYQSAVASSVERLRALNQPLEDIKALAGSSPDALGVIIGAAAQVSKTLSTIVPPEEFRALHAMFASAAELADNAARTRREAALTGDMRRAWDASAAAAGALMLESRARSELQNLLRLPQLSR
jgi:hypothetical protein